MHLLHWDDKNELVLAEFLVNPPRYAILSHRWDADEPTFQDLKGRTGKNKAGYKKLEFCGMQAVLDDLEYFWVDTVCIDKTNSTEVIEAIVSMFRWYQESAVCYVFLQDVSTPDGFWQAAWFDRGWTLQELIAPSNVRFYMADGTNIGDKSGTLQADLSKRTGIPEKALAGEPLKNFSIDERLHWAEHRITTRPEDRAYCLLGIFGVSMSVIYGEGFDKATARLCIELRQLNASLKQEPGAPPLPARPLATQHKVVDNNGYNCFGDVHWRDINWTLKIRVWRLLGECKKCGFEQNGGREHPFWAGPSVPGCDGEHIPWKLIEQRFHHKSSDPSRQVIGYRSGTYRCFICRDEKLRGRHETFEHVKELHTLAQIRDAKP